MEIFFDYKFIFIVVAISLMLYSYIPYFVDMFAGKTKPHIYTWIIWFITQGTASAAAIYGGSGMTGFGLWSGTFMVFLVVISSLKFGTKNITISDTISLCLALFSVILWWQMKNPLPAVLMVSLIDGLGYIPSFRKTWQDPNSETPSFWLVICLSTIFTLLANTNFSLITTFYLIVMTICNFIMFSISYFRKI